MPSSRLRSVTPLADQRVNADRGQQERETAECRRRASSAVRCRVSDALFEPRRHRESAETASIGSTSAIARRIAASVTAPSRGLLESSTRSRPAVKSAQSAGRKLRKRQVG